jgi:hypothetical protein
MRDYQLGNECKDAAHQRTRRLTGSRLVREYPRSSAGNLPVGHVAGTYDLSSRPYPAPGTVVVHNWFMSNSPEPKWVLQIPFITSPGFTLVERRVVSFGGLQAELGPSGAGYTSIRIEGLESEQAARELFRSLLVGLLVGSLNVSWGIRVQNDVKALYKDSPKPNERGMPLIFQEGRDLSELIISPGTVTMQFEKVLPKLLASLEFGLTSKSAQRIMTNRYVKLATELYVDSYFEASDSARFIGLIGVLEVLKDKNRASDSARRLVDEWIRDVATSLEGNELESFLGNLRRLKNLSISQGIVSVVGRHLGHERVKEAKELYDIRSKLVHDGIRPADPASTVRRARQIVMDLLAHILVTGSL